MRSGSFQVMHEESRGLGMVLQSSTVQRDFGFALLPTAQGLFLPCISACCPPCPAKPTCLPGGVSAHHHTPKDPQIFLTHLFRTMLMARRRRPKIMTAKESARME